MIVERRAAITSTFSPNKSYIKQPLIIAYVFALILAISQQTFAGGEYSDLNQWDPKLSDSIDYFDPIAREIGDEVLSAYPEYALRVLYETQLYIAFQRHLNRLSGDARAKAESEHLKWLNRVYAEYEEEGDFFKNGKLGMLTAEKILIERIQEKLKVFK
jgi:hypothetical protein